jgi:hypothetical protein
MSAIWGWQDGTPPLPLPGGCPHGLGHQPRGIAGAVLGLGCGFSGVLRFRVRKRPHCVKISTSFQKKPDVNQNSASTHVLPNLT